MIVILEPGCVYALPRVVAIRSVQKHDDGGGGGGGGPAGTATYRYRVAWSYPPGAESKSLNEAQLDWYLTNIAKEQRTCFLASTLETQFNVKRDRELRGSLFGVAACEDPMVVTPGFCDAQTAHFILQEDQHELRAVLGTLDRTVVHTISCPATPTPAQVAAEVGYLVSSIHQIGFPRAQERDRALKLVVASSAALLSYETIVSRLLGTGQYLAVDIVTDMGFLEPTLQRNCDVTVNNHQGVLTTTTTRSTTVVARRGMSPSLARRTNRAQLIAVGAVAPKVISECVHCGRAFWDATQLEAHLHQRGVHVCVCCPSKFCEEAKLRQHLRTAHVHCHCGCPQRYYPDADAQQVHLQFERNHPITCLCGAQCANSKLFFEHCTRESEREAGGDDVDAPMLHTLWLARVVTRRHSLRTLELSIQKDRELSCLNVSILCQRCAQFVRVTVSTATVMCFNKLFESNTLSADSVKKALDEALARHEGSCSGRLPDYYTREVAGARDLSAVPQRWLAPPPPPPQPAKKKAIKNNNVKSVPDAAPPSTHVDPSVVVTVAEGSNLNTSLGASAHSAASSCAASSSSRSSSAASSH